MNEQERATILAGLRLFQASMEGSDPDVDVLAIATNGGEWGTMDDDEIDNLCQRINAGATIEKRGSADFVRLVANMFIEGECEDHGHPIDECGEEQCCTSDCVVYEPSGNDAEITTLYELIATARQLPNTGEPERVYVVVTAQSGIIEGAALFRDGDQADAHARAEWRSMTGSDEPDPDSTTGTHDDDNDVWVFEEQLGGDARRDDGGNAAQIRELARDQFHRDGELEIDDDAIVSFAHEHGPGQPCNNADPDGAYVAAWVWVDLSEVVLVEADEEGD